MSTQINIRKKTSDLVVLLVIFAFGVTVSYLAVVHATHTFAKSQGVSPELLKTDDTLQLADQVATKASDVVLADTGCGCPSCCAVSEVL